MHIQGFNVSVSSQHSSQSVQSSSGTITSSQQTAQFAVSMQKELSKQNTPEYSAKKNGKGENDQGQNANSQGQNQNGQGQNINTHGQNQNEQGQNVNNQGQNQNGQGQNVNSQGQSDKEIYQSLLENAREETVGRLIRGSPISRIMNARGQRAPATPQELRARLSQMIYEILTGRSSRMRPRHAGNAEDAQQAQPGQGAGFSNFFFGAFGNESLARVQGIAGLSNMHSFEFESETVSYQANGVVHTADGRTITVDISMHMSRQFVSFMGISAESGALVDPLVINYGGTAASLMNERFMFDLTMDGNLDSLSVLGEGSGFLAIDRNGDGKINDGSELFGPRTGCGFSELRKYDTDGNGWIDENDEIFDKLVVWRRDENGNDIVRTLRELGIGAIFLGDISTEFSFKGESNTTLGVMRSTSFFLKQCGGAGTLSHIDLAM